MPYKIMVANNIIINTTALLVGHNKSMGNNGKYIRVLLHCSSDILLRFTEQYSLAEETLAVYDLLMTIPKMAPGTSFIIAPYWLSGIKIYKIKEIEPLQVDLP